MEEDDGGESGDAKSNVRKRRKMCHDFLSTIDQTGELVALFHEDGVDEVKQERALRAELQSRAMDSQQYKEFCEARQTSFTPKYRNQRFKEWLMGGVTLDIKPNPMALEVMGYMAY